jgi:hypothetical protein
MVVGFNKLKELGFCGSRLKRGSRFGVCMRSLKFQAKPPPRLHEVDIGGEIDGKPWCIYQ